MANVHYFLLAVMMLGAKAGGFFTGPTIAMLLLNLLVLYVEVWFLYLTKVVASCHAVLALFDGAEEQRRRRHGRGRHRDGKESRKLILFQTPAFGTFNSN